jgi:regulator of cell morphogenesis and NO signaling
MINFENIQKSPIKDIVSENYIFASVLYYFGISFFQYEKNSLKEVCDKYRLNPRQLIDELEDWAKRKEPSPEDLYLHPIEVLVSYLKRKHYFFVRQELPFLSNMISGIQSEILDYKNILNDLRMMFPLFVEDFIHHIHEEESRLFTRIQLLHDIENDEFDLPLTLHILEKDPIALLAETHEIHDDEMQGIRKLTKNYFLPDTAPIGLKVLYHELQNFEKELIIHAQIEDQLLFPKAVELEKEVLRKVRKKILNN